MLVRLESVATNHEAKKISAHLISGCRGGRGAPRERVGRRLRELM